MTDDEHLIMGEVTNLREAVDAQTAGLMSMLAIQAQHSAMLKEVLKACTAEPKGPSPLLKLLLKIETAVARIEAAVTHPAH